jgi:hypothetical protein
MTSNTLQFLELTLTAKFTTAFAEQKPIGNFKLMIVLTFISRIIAPIGPLSLNGMDPVHKTFYFNSTEIHYVDHTNSGDLSVFAFCSEQGELFHAVLYQSEPLSKLVGTYFNLQLLIFVFSSKSTRTFTNWTSWTLCKLKIGR